MCCNVVPLGWLRAAGVCGPYKVMNLQSYEEVIKFFIPLRYMTGQSIVS